MGSADKCAKLELIFKPPPIVQEPKATSLSLSEHGPVTIKQNLKLCLMSRINPMALIGCLGAACHLCTMHELQTNVHISVM